MRRLILRLNLSIVFALVMTHLPVVAQVTVTLPNLEVGAGASELIAVNVSDLTGHEVKSFEFTVSYDPTIIEITGVSVAGTLTASVAPIVNTTTSGKVSIAWADAFALEGSGVLVNLQASFLKEGTSALTLDTFKFNEGLPSATKINGEVTVGAGSAGSVNVSLPASTSGTDGGGQITVPITIDDVSGKNVTSYSFTLIFDPAVINVVGYTTTGTLSAGASPSVNTGTPGEITVNWSNGSALSGSGILGNLLISPVAMGVSTLTFITIQFNSGDPTAKVTNGSVTINDGGDYISVSLPALNGEIGESISIPIVTGDLTGENVFSYVFSFVYNPADITISGASTSGTLSAGNAVVVNLDSPGQAIVSMSSAVPLTGSGVLVNLEGEFVGPGFSEMSFASFQYNDGIPEVATIDGSVTVGGFATYIQIVHNSSDAPPVDIYLNDVLQVDAITYGSATMFLELTVPNVKLDVVSNGEGNNANPITSINVSLESLKDYVAVINGLYSGSGKQALGLVVQDSQQRSTDENTVGLNVFQGSPDAPLINAYIVDDTDAYNRILTLAKGLGFGDSYLSKEFEPGFYNIELTENSGERIGIYRADLSRTGGDAILFMIQGFVNPIVGQPNLSIAAYAPNGQSIFLPVETDSEEEETLPDEFSLDGNYPNPFNPTTSIEFNLPEPASVRIDVFDMIGRRVMSTAEQTFLAGTGHTFHLDASGLSSGMYVYRLVAQGVRQSYVDSRTMTLLK